MKIISWNINGIRSILKKDFLSLVVAWDADIICLQETKINYHLPLNLPAYQDFWTHGERPGYSGTLILVKKSLLSAVTSREAEPFLIAEGRCTWLEFPHAHLLNVYFPNGGRSAERLSYKMKYYQQFLAFIKKLNQKKGIIFTGDINTAHQEIDLARPKENSKNTGFLPAERAWIDEVVSENFIDVWRHFHPQEIAYSWWDYKTRARARNVGWRIDYFFASQKLLANIQDCQILVDVGGSDHAPVSLTINGLL